ncbi:MAG: POTRA domain-containing protein [Bacteroidota bacterium]
MRAYRLSSLPVLFLALSLTASSQVQRIQLPPNTPLGVLDTVIVAGNTKTKSYVITDEMSLKRGDTVTVDAIEYDRNRIYGLGLFTRVDIAYDSLPGVRFLYVDVSERWYLIPYPIFGFRDGDPKRPYGGAGILHNNLGGRNQKLSGALIFGSDPSVGVSFSDPLIDRVHRLYFSGGLSFSKVRNKSEVELARTGPFDEYHYDLNGSIGKRFTLSQTAGMNLGYHIVHTSTWWPGRTVSNDGTDRMVYATLSYSLDTRDLYEYASRGVYAGVALTKYGMGESRVNFARAYGDFRGYGQLPFGLTIASRLFGNIGWGGEIPTYNHVYFGYGDRLRGWFHTVLEGDDITGFTLELRRFILPPRVFRMTSLPLPDEFTVWRFGISAALFANTGAVWYRGDKLDWSSLYSGYGGGLHFLLPYSVIIRVEYAWNQYRRGEFILDLRGSI